MTVAQFAGREERCRATGLIYRKCFQTEDKNPGEKLSKVPDVGTVQELPMHYRASIPGPEGEQDAILTAPHDA